MVQNCRQVTDELLCRNNTECAWTSLIGSSLFGCYANIDDAAVKKCRNTKRRNAARRVPHSAQLSFDAGASDRRNTLSVVEIHGRLQ